MNSILEWIRDNKLVVGGLSMMFLAAFGINYYLTSIKKAPDIGVDAIPIDKDQIKQDVKKLTEKGTTQKGNLENINTSKVVNVQKIKVKKKKYNKDEVVLKIKELFKKVKKEYREEFTNNKEIIINNYKKTLGKGNFYKIADKYSIYGLNVAIVKYYINKGKINVLGKCIDKNDNYLKIIYGDFLECLIEKNPEYFFGSTYPALLLKKQIKF